MFARAARVPRRSFAFLMALLLSASGRAAEPVVSQSNSTLWGQSTEGTVLKLKDAASGFTNPQRPQPMIWTGQKPAQRFKNYVRSLTFDTGKNNPGAIGAQFIANNTGALREVTIRSGDGRGPIGLDLGYSDEQGPCLIKNVRVIGFDVGISAKHAVDSITLENIALEGQNVVGFRNAGQCASLRALKSTGAVPAVENSGAGVLVLLDSALTGQGNAAANAAIVNQQPAALLARNVTVSGYQTAIQNTSGHGKSDPRLAAAEEFVSHPILSLFPSPQKSLGLPIKETPEVPWDDPQQWASVVKFGAQCGTGRNVADATDAIQKALDSGAKTVYFPKGSFTISDTLHIRGNVQRIIGLGQNAAVRGEGKFQFDDGAAPVVILENLQGTGSGVIHASRRTLVLRNMHLNAMGGSATYSNTGTGEVFMEDVGGKGFVFTRQNAWLRQLNTEPRATKIVNDGGTLWILGLKTERGGTLVHTKGGGKTEVAGGFCYTTTDPQQDPMFLVEDSSLSVTLGESMFSKKFKAFDPIVREIRGDQMRELRWGAAPHRTGGSMLPLFVGHLPPDEKR